MSADMAVNFDALLAAGISDAACRYGDRDAMLYALGIGMGQYGSDLREQAFIYEGRGLRVVPSMAPLLVDYGFLREHRLDPAALAIAEQKLELYRPLPASADLSVDSRVVAVLDLGQGQGVGILIESEARLARDATVLFTLSSLLVSAEDSGFRGPPASGPLPHQLPARDPDLLCESVSHATMPYVFRLLGDRNPRYADDAAARAQGFPRRPLAEQCTIGMACRAILETICEFDPTLIAGLDLRLVDTLYPGETLTVEMWQERNIVSFRGVVRSRDAVIVDNGKCTLAA